MYGAIADPLKKNILVYTGLTLFIFHFGFIIIFCFADKFGDSPLVSVAGKYSFPLFNQDWKMFAPEPPMKNIKMLYSCTFHDSIKSEWTDPGKETLEKFQSIRFWNYGKQYNIYESLYRNYIGTKRGDPWQSMTNHYLIDMAKKEFPNKKISRINFSFGEKNISGIGQKDTSSTLGNAPWTAIHTIILNE